MKKILGLALIATMIMSCSADDVAQRTADCECMVVTQVEPVYVNPQGQGVYEVWGRGVCDNEMKYIQYTWDKPLVHFYVGEFCPEEDMNELN